jgi:DNA invertase Pin-like site-specific DNA recombinase
MADDDPLGPTSYVIYASKSTLDVADSLGSQLLECREYIKRRGGLIDSEHTDEAASGYHASRGPGLVAAKARAADLARLGLKVVLLVTASDRLARGDGARAAHLVEHLLEARRCSYQLDAVTEDLSDLALVAILGERANHDSRIKGEHTKRGMAAAIRRGQRMGLPPYGYRTVVVAYDEVKRKPVKETVVIPEQGGRRPADLH